MVDEKFILIGGAPTTGKSTMAKQLAKHFDLPWISTDQLRAIVKPYGDVDRFPTLYGASNVSAEEFLTRYSVQEISDMEFAQGKDVWPAVTALLQSNKDWNRGCIVEGVNILPELVANTDYPNKSLVKAVFLIDLDEDRMRKVVYERGLYDSADKYSDDVKEKEVEWAMTFTHRIQKEAVELGFPCIEISKTDDDLSRVIDALDG